MMALLVGAAALCALASSGQFLYPSVLGAKQNVATASRRQQSVPSGMLLQLRNVGLTSLASVVALFEVPGRRPPPSIVRACDVLCSYASSEWPYLCVRRPADPLVELYMYSPRSVFFVSFSFFLLFIWFLKLNYSSFSFPQFYSPCLQSCQ